MRFELNLPPERTQSFVDHLNARLRQQSERGMGRAGRLLDGGYATIVELRFRIDEQLCALEWSLLHDARGALLYLEVNSVDPGLAPETWTSAVQRFMNATFAAALGEQSKKYFQRRIYHYLGTQLDGEYWLPGYRVAPVDLPDPAPNNPACERVIAIDMMVPAIDRTHASALAVEVSARIAARLSLLLNVGLYLPQPRYRWVLPNPAPEMGTESVCRLATFVHPELYPDAMPGKGVSCKLGRFESPDEPAYGFQVLRLPQHSRKILRFLEKADPRVVNAFDAAARLCQVGAILGQHYASAGLAYRVAAIEAASAATSPKGSFASFMRLYAKHSDNLEEVIEFLYREVRSAHFHAGEFPLGEFDRSWFIDSLMNPWAMNRLAVNSHCEALTRAALMNWTLSLSDCEEAQNV